MIKTIFEGLTKNSKDAKELALNFYGPIFLLYSIYDGAEEKQNIVNMLEEHVEHFSHIIQENF